MTFGHTEETNAPRQGLFAKTRLPKPYDVVCRLASGGSRKTSFSDEVEEVARNLVGWKFLWFCARLRCTCFVTKQRIRLCETAIERAQFVKRHKPQCALFRRSIFHNIDQLAPAIRPVENQLIGQGGARANHSKNQSTNFPAWLGGLVQCSVASMDAIGSFTLLLLAAMPLLLVAMP